MSNGVKKNNTKPNKAIRYRCCFAFAKNVVFVNIYICISDIAIETKDPRDREVPAYIAFIGAW